MDILLFGMQGSGKGTQAKLLMKEENYYYFSVGDILRGILAKEDDPVAKEIQSYMKKGDLVPDEIIFGLLADFLLEAFSTTRPIIFDGLPRNLAQYRMLTQLLEGKGRDYVGLYYDLPLKITLERIEMRKRKSNGTEDAREDDNNMNSVLTRVNNFFVHTFPVLKEAILSERIEIVDASGTPEEVRAATLAAFSQRAANRSKTL